MQILSKICAIIAGTLMFVTPALLLVWIVRLFTKKSAKKVREYCPYLRRMLYSGSSYWRFFRPSRDF